ncbi:MAG: putative sigma-54 modulation protein [Solirubrobacteraceae bacterium]|jgi:putative sigma-54 modulation protein|nr:putative sigma-54 modulation protein [Solirubrobacteraceae bacterium]MEA2301291.1 putative sigma-54 modulation protein [Solirubrobacteraceae bacterium]MEA2354866.1 putative sigma-54 modulation protein [Solirubrobacteraceae bacterium]
MQIDVKGRNVPVTDELREHVRKRFATVDKQVPWMSARLEIEFSQERNPAIPEAHVAEATLYLKGVTLRAKDASPRDCEHALNLCAHELTRQVKRHRDKRRHRREARDPGVAGNISAAM